MNKILIENLSETSCGETYLTLISMFMNFCILVVWFVVLALFLTSSLAYFGGLV